MGSLDTSGGGWQPVGGICECGCRPLTSCEVEHIQDSSHSSSLCSQSPVGDRSLQPFLPSFLLSRQHRLSFLCLYCKCITGSMLLASEQFFSSVLVLQIFVSMCVFLWQRLESRLGHCWFSVRPTGIQCSRKEFIIFGKMPWWLSQNPWWCP